MPQAYGYHLNDNVRKLLRQHPEGITIKELTEKLNGLLQLNHPANGRDYNLLRHRVYLKCVSLKTLEYATMEKYTTEIKTEYYKVKPTEKC